MENHISENAKKVHLVSLGCSRNRVDSEVMLGSLFERGWQSTDVAEEADAGSEKSMDNSSD